MPPSYRKVRPNRPIDLHSFLRIFVRLSQCVAESMTGCRHYCFVTPYHLHARYKNVGFLLSMLISPDSKSRFIASKRGMPMKQMSEAERVDSGSSLYGPNQFSAQLTSIACMSVAHISAQHRYCEKAKKNDISRGLYPGSANSKLCAMQGSVATLHHSNADPIDHMPSRSYWYPRQSIAKGLTARWKNVILSLAAMSVKQSNPLRDG